MITPTININGTDAGDLAAQYEAALEAMSAAIEAVSDITIHGRDFPQGNVGEAALIRNNHLKTLLAIGQEVQEVVLELYDIQQKRK